MATLTGRVALVTGASRGLGRGIAVGLAECGATVYVTGRSTGKRPGELPGTIEQTAAEVTVAGGIGVAVECDHRDDEQVANLFARVRRETGRLDVLVNNAQASPDQAVLWGSPRSWEVPISLWDDLIDVGLRSHFVAAHFAVPLMLEQGRGLIVNVASHGSAIGKRPGSRTLISYSVAKAGLHRLTGDLAAELDGSGVVVLAVWPPASRTEGVLARARELGGVDDWQEPIFTGRVLAALVGSDDLAAHAGAALVVTELAAELGVG